MEKWLRLYKGEYLVCSRCGAPCHDDEESPGLPLRCSNCGAEMDKGTYPADPETLIRELKKYMDYDFPDDLRDTLVDEVLERLKELEALRGMLDAQWRWWFE